MIVFSLMNEYLLANVWMRRCGDMYEMLVGKLELSVEHGLTLFSFARFS